jgi:hypothetical protein
MSDFIPLLVEEGWPRNARSGWSGTGAFKNAFLRAPAFLTTPHRFARTPPHRGGELILCNHFRSAAFSLLEWN